MHCRSLRQVFETLFRRSASSIPRTSSQSQSAHMVTSLIPTCASFANNLGDRQRCVATTTTMSPFCARLRRACGDPSVLSRQHSAAHTGLYGRLPCTSTQVRRPAGDRFTRPSRRVMRMVTFPITGQWNSTGSPAGDVVEKRGQPSRRRSRSRCRRSATSRRSMSSSVL
jgi:hypothetical protein